MSLYNVLVGLVAAVALVVGVLGFDSGGDEGVGAFPGPTVLQKMFFEAGFDANDDVTVDTSDLFVDTSADEVGVGTSSPDALFHVSAGANATTTASYDGGNADSKSCFEVRNSAGTDQRAYINGTSWVIEAGNC